MPHRSTLNFGGSTSMEISDMLEISKDNDSDDDDDSEMLVEMEPADISDMPVSMTTHGADTDWLNDMVEQSRINDEAWSCCICHNFTSQKMRGIRLHIARVHNVKPKPERIPQELLDNSDDDVSDNDEDSDYERSKKQSPFKREKELAWLKQALDASVIQIKGENGPSTVYFCSICQEVTCKSEFGLRRHIAASHKKHMSNDTTPRTKKSNERTSNDILEEKIANARKELEGVNGEGVMIMCDECDSGKVFETEVEYRRHFIRQHAEKKDAKLNPQEKMFLKQGMRNGARMIDGEVIYICDACNVSFKSYGGLRYHILTKHMHEVNGSRREASVQRPMPVLLPIPIYAPEAADETADLSSDNADSSQNDIQGKLTKVSEMSDAEAGWFKRSLKKSKYKTMTDNCWKCFLCNKKLATSNKIRYHLMVKHLPFYSLGPEAYAKHISKFKKRVDNDSDPEEVRGKYLKSSEMNVVDQNWLKDNIKRSRIKNHHEDCWRCWICQRNITSYSTIRYHFTVDHLPYWKKGDQTFSRHVNSWRKDQDMEILEVTPSFPEHLENDILPFFSVKHETESAKGKFVKASEMDESERQWLRMNIRKSRVRNVNEDLWNCWICLKSYETNGTARYHFVVEHLPSWKLGDAKFAEHVSYCQKMAKFLGRKSKPKVMASAICKLSPYLKKKRRCTHCYLQFFKREDFRNHMMIHTLSDPILPLLNFQKCDQCSMTFRNADDLMLHNVGHQLNENSKIIPTKGIAWNLSVHRNHISELRHKPEESWTHSCGHCGKFYENQDIVNRHIFVFHLNPIVCPHDQKEFTKRASFMNHMYLQHAEPQKCPHCNIELHGNVEKLEHLKVCEEKQLQCDHCGERFGSKVRLIFHLREELGITEYSCEICGESFGSKIDLGVHELEHSQEVS